LDIFFCKRGLCYLYKAFAIYLNKLWVVGFGLWFVGQGVIEELDFNHFYGVEHR
jgi:hypothetical protein